MLANIGPGDEVILPAYTFTSAATAVTKFGATPVFVDIETETKGIDVSQVREAITPRTKAISWVNYAGVAPDIEGLQSLAKEFNLLLIEDNAHGLGGSYKGRPLGSFGDFATQSFHATKNIQCGEGGALVLNNSKYIDRAEIIREKGTDRSRFIRGEIQKYQWLDEGSSYLLAESLAAVLLGQLEEFSKIQEARESTIERYLIGTKLIREKFELPDEAIYSKPYGTSHMFYLCVQSEKRQRLIKFLRNKEIFAGSHYQNLAASQKGITYQKASRSVFEVTAKFSDSIVRFPLFISEKDFSDEVINSIVEFFEGGY
jgi:dTDP-4-amino-4,6-dideoxygalactose transaminase